MEGENNKWRGIKENKWQEEICLGAIREMKANWIDHIARRGCFQKLIVEEKTADERGKGRRIWNVDGVQIGWRGEVIKKLKKQHRSRKTEKGGGVELKSVLGPNQH